MIQEFWRSISKDLEQQRESPTADWKKNYIETDFLIKLSEKVTRLCEKDNAKKKRCNKQVGQPVETSYYTFRRYLQLAPPNSGDAKTRHIYAIYLGYKSCEDYCEKKNIPTIIKKKGSRPSADSIDRLSIDFLKKQLKKKYKENPIFNYISLLGSQQIDIERFPMEQFYIDLSYINKKEISRQEDLQLQEKEAIQQKHIRQLVFHNSFPHDLISDKVLLQNKQSVVLGTPGSGKSTFAKWLCWRWVQPKESTISKLLIYINLRELRFTSTNSISDYLVRKYLPNISTSIVQATLKEEKENLLFLLDGLDEIPTNKKALLWEDLHDIGNKLSYIVFTRPYGMINQSFDYDLSFEIIGFNKTTRQQYLNNFLTQRPDVSAINLLDIIESNLVLKDFSFNPLMLSYIVLVYLKEQEQAEQILANIESAYELQEQLLSWLKQYYYTKRFEQSFDDLLSESQSFAYEMEMEQLFLYESKTTVNKFSKLTTAIAQLGVGNKEMTKENHWNFHFNTITFQEFLGAIHIGHTISPNALLYLLENQLQWNFARMLVGYCSLHGKQSVIDNVLRTLQHLFKTTKKRYYQHLYIYLLGELKKVHLAVYTQEDSLNSLLDNYVNTPSNSNWESVILESIGRLYTKLSVDKKAIFKQFILKQLDGVLQKDFFGKRASNANKFTNRLVTRLYLQEDEVFVNEFLERFKIFVLEHKITRQAIAQDKNNELLIKQEMSENNRLILLLRLLGEVKEEFLHYITIRFLPKLFAHRFAFYDLKYWAFLLHLIEKHQAISKVLFVLHDSWCYSFKSNLVPLTNIWRNIARRMDNLEEDVSLNTTILFQSAYKSLIAYKKFNLTAKINRRKEQYLPDILSSIFKRRNLQIAAVKGTQIFQELLVYSLIYEFTGSNLCVLSTTYQEILDTSPCDYDLLIPFAAKLFTIEELKNQEFLFGKKLCQATIDYQLEHKFESESFSREKFEVFLN